MRDGTGRVFGAVDDYGGMSNTHSVHRRSNSRTSAKDRNQGPGTENLQEELDVSRDPYKDYKLILKERVP